MSLSFPSLTVVVLTLNEEKHLERCIRSVAALNPRIVVVDSFSTDRRIEIAEGLGAVVFAHPFKNQAEQFQWALDNCNIETDWILRLDADEYLETRLLDEIRERLPHLEPGVTGVLLKRKVIFRDRWIRWGGFYPSVYLRLWRRGAARVEQRWSDEHVVLIHGRSIIFENDFVDHNLNDITWWTDKHNRYATRHMVDFINLEVPLFSYDSGVDNAGNRQAKRRRFLRNKVFARPPCICAELSIFFNAMS